MLFRIAGVVCCLAVAGDFVQQGACFEARFVWGSKSKLDFARAATLRKHCSGRGDPVKGFVVMLLGAIGAAAKTFGHHMCPCQGRGLDFLRACLLVCMCMRGRRDEGLFVVCALLFGNVAWEMQSWTRLRVTWARPQF